MTTTHVSGEGVSVHVVSWTLATCAAAVLAGTVYAARHPSSAHATTTTAQQQQQCDDDNNDATGGGVVCVAVCHDKGGGHVGTSRDNSSNNRKTTTMAVDVWSESKATTAMAVDAHVGSGSVVHATPPFASFQRAYLLVRACCFYAEFLRGPYTMALYAANDLTLEQRALLYVLTYASSLLLGTVVSAAADVMGRVYMCRGFCLVYLLALLTHVCSGNFYVLSAGRVLLGVSGLLLSTAFETWMVSQHRARGYSAAQLQDTNFKACYLVGAVAVLAGLTAEVSVWASGGSYAAPLACAMPPLLVALYTMRTWRESYGSFDDEGGGGSGGSRDDDDDDHTVDGGSGGNESYKDGNSSSGHSGYGDAGDGDERTRNGNTRRRGGGGSGCVWSLRALYRVVCIGGRSLARSRRTQLLGACEALFDTAFGLWLFCWTLALDATTLQTPYGLIFTTLMLCTMLGSLLTRLRLPASAAVASHARWQSSLLLGTHVSATVAMLLTVLLYRYKIAVLLCQALFETAMGAYQALHPTLRAVCVCDEQRAAVTTLFLVPSQAAVPLLLLARLPPGWLLSIAAVLLATSTACAAALLRYL